ncbi:META domain-containing protein [Propionicimonas sp.]|uniref:META domain-containing protein n=1 Tax=Propionicimonas sp. TaxID=1955623 RepID=UPI0039E61B06
MSEIEERFRAGLRQAVAREPGLGRVDIDEVIARGASGAPIPVRGRAPRWLAAVAALTLVAGIGAAAWLARTPEALPAVPVGSPGTSSTTAAPDLAGTSWQAIQIGGRAVVASSRGVPSLRFTDDQIVVAADPCNSRQGSYVLDGSSLLFSGWGPHTAIGCATAQQERFAEAIDATRAVRIVAAHGTVAEDVLELVDADSTVVMQLVPAIGSGTPEPTSAPSGSPSASATGTASALVTPVTAPDQLTGGRWYARELGGREVVAVDGRVPTLVFSPRDGLVEGTDPCNTGSGRYTLDGGALAITGWASNAKACEPDQQQRFTGALAGTVRAERDGDLLVLLGRTAPSSRASDLRRRTRSRCGCATRRRSTSRRWRCGSRTAPASSTGRWRRETPPTTRTPDVRSTPTRGCR